MQVPYKFLADLELSMQNGILTYVNNVATLLFFIFLVGTMRCQGQLARTSINSHLQN